MAKINGAEKALKRIEIVAEIARNSKIEQAQALARKCYESDYKDCSDLFDE